MSRGRYLFSIVAAAVLMAGLAPRMAAQQTPTQTPQTQPSQTQPSQAQPPSQTPEQSNPGQQAQPTEPTPGAQAPQSQGVQTFTGTIVKSGDKYVFKDETTEKTYDIDHQQEIAQHVGNRVRFQGTLDPSGKMIHIGALKR